VEHAVSPVQNSAFIDENRPAKTRVLDICARDRARLERHHNDMDVKARERRFLLLQLQQMPSARQSTEMPMEDEQQPVSLVILETMNTSLDVRQGERGGVSRILCHVSCDSKRDDAL
jgi:hypothetical protein